MGKKDKKQTQTQRLDPSSQGHVNRMRRAGTGAAADIMNAPGSFFAGADTRPISQQIEPFMNPYIDQVIGGLGSHFDRLRQQAIVGANQSATQAGAFNSARHGIAQAERLGALDQQQAQQVGGLLSGQFNTAMQQGLQHSEYLRALRERQLQEPIFRRQLEQQFLAGSYGGPTGSTQESITPGNFWADVAGLGLTAAGLFAGGPAGLTAAQSMLARPGVGVTGTPMATPRPIGVGGGPINMPTVTPLYGRG